MVLAKISLTEAKDMPSFGISEGSLSLLTAQELLSLRSHLFFSQGIQQNV